MATVEDTGFATPGADSAKPTVDEPNASIVASDRASVANSAIFALQTIQQHHVSLSQMADQKANIVIAAASVIFALVVSQGHADKLSPSLLILAFSAFAGAGLCILAVMPSIGRPQRAVNHNMLFFGAFADLPEAEWRDHMVEILSSNPGIHDAMLRDIHQMGSVLKHRKFKYLGYGYRVFVVGLALTLVAYCLEQVLR